MKRLFVLTALLLSSTVYAATNQPQNIGKVKATALVLGVKTLAQLDALTPDDTNQVMVCSNCKFALCLSTGSTLPGQWVVVGSTIPAASSGNAQPLHCQ